MRGKSHTVVSAAAWAIGEPAVLLRLGAPLGDLGTYIATTVAAGGAGLAPDCDHEQATIAQSFGPVSRGLVSVVQHTLGPHRHGAHSILFCLGLGAAVYGLVGAWPAWTLGITLAICGAWFGRTQVHGHEARHEVMGAAIVAGGIATQLIAVGHILGVAVCVGALVHLAADLVMRDAGIMLFWPFTHQKFSLGLLKPEREVKDRSGRVVRVEGGEGEKAVAWAARVMIPLAALWWYWPR